MALRNVGAKRRGPVRLTLPISVASDLEKFDRALANASQVLEGGNRYSRWNVDCMQARDFVVDPASLEVRMAAYEP